MVSLCATIEARASRLLWVLAASWEVEGIEAPRATRPSDTVILLGDDLDNWTGRDGGPVDWRLKQGILEVQPGAGDIMTVERFTDFFLHLDFRCPHMPEATGQEKGNSGVFLQGRYEIQILDSYGVRSPGKGDCGAIYGQIAPLVNSCHPPLAWQAYDVIFRAARTKRIGVEEPARLTVLHNGRVIHNNVELRGTTSGALDEKEGKPGPLLLQDHGDLVAYRNIWAIHLPPEGSDLYEPE